MADYCFKVLKWKRAVVAADDFAYGMNRRPASSACSRTSAESGAAALFALAVPDYGSYLAQLKTNVDGVFFGYAGSNGFRFLRQLNEYGLKGKFGLAAGIRRWMSLSCATWATRR